MLNLGIKFEKRIKRLHQLFANLVFPAFQQVHGHLRLLATLEGDFRVPDLFEFVRGKETHAVDERQFGHASFYREFLCRTRPSEPRASASGCRLRLKSLVGTGRFELPTCRLGGDRSIHLSYVPAMKPS
jgi:hypothetical protein